MSTGTSLPTMQPMTKHVKRRNNNSPDAAKTVTPQKQEGGEPSTNRNLKRYRYSSLVFPRLDHFDPEACPERRPDYALSGRPVSTCTDDEFSVENTTTLSRKPYAEVLKTGQTKNLAPLQGTMSQRVEIEETKASQSSASVHSSSSTQTLDNSSDDSDDLWESASSLRPDLCAHSQDKACRCTLPRERGQSSGLCMLCDADGCHLQVVSGFCTSDAGDPDDWQVVDHVDEGKPEPSPTQPTMALLRAMQQGRLGSR
jgi:hypothetical protein